MDNRIDTLGAYLKTECSARLRTNRYNEQRISTFDFIVGDSWGEASLLLDPHTTEEEEMKTWARFLMRKLREPKTRYGRWLVRLALKHF